MSTISQYKTDAQNFLKNFTREAIALAKKQKLPDFSKLSKEDLKLSKIWSGTTTLGKGLPNFSKIADVNIPSQPFLGQRSMSYPSTFMAKVAKLPIIYYKRTNSLWKYWMIACVCCLPIFARFAKLEGNIPNTEQIQVDLQTKPTNYPDK